MAKNTKIPRKRPLCRWLTLSWRAVIIWLPGSPPASGTAGCSGWPGSFAGGSREAVVSGTGALEQSSPKELCRGPTLPHKHQRKETGRHKEHWILSQSLSVEFCIHQLPATGSLTSRFSEPRLPNLWYGNNGIYLTWLLQWWNEGIIHILFF